MHTAVVIADGQIHQKRIVMGKYGAQGTMHTIINTKALRDVVDILQENKRWKFQSTWYKKDINHNYINA